MGHFWKQSNDLLEVGYKWYTENREHSVVVSANTESVSFEPDSLESDSLDSLDSASAVPSSSTGHSGDMDSRPTVRAEPVPQASLNSASRRFRRSGLGQFQKNLAG